MVLTVAGPEDQVDVALVVGAQEDAAPGDIALAVVTEGSGHALVLNLIRLLLLRVEGHEGGSTSGVAASVGVSDACSVC